MPSCGSVLVASSRVYALVAVLTSMVKNLSEFLCICYPSNIQMLGGRVPYDQPAADVWPIDQWSVSWPVRQSRRRRGFLSKPPVSSSKSTTHTSRCATAVCYRPNNNTPSVHGPYIIKAGRLYIQARIQDFLKGGGGAKGGGVIAPVGEKLLFEHKKISATRGGDHPCKPPLDPPLIYDPLYACIQI